MKRNELLHFLLWLYRTEDGKSEISVCENLIDMYYQEVSLDNTDVLEDLKQMSNNYIVYDGNYVIPKSVLDLYIEYLEYKA